MGNANTLFVLSHPVAVAVIGLACLLLWRSDAQYPKTLLCFGVGYVCYSMGAVSQIMAPSGNNVLHAGLAGLFYSVAAFCVSRGTVMLAGASFRYVVPVIVMVAFAVYGLYFLVVQNDPVMRLIGFNTAMVLLFTYAAVRARVLASGSLTEKLTYYAFVAFIISAVPCTWNNVQRELHGTAFDPTTHWFATNVCVYAFSLIFGLMLIITVMHKRVTAERELSETDALTGLNNRRGFAQQAEKLLARATSFAVLVLDLDYFKRINDAYGHVMGDQVLEQVAQVIEDSLPRGALSARLGGEEFVVLLANSSFEAAEQLAYRIGGRIEAFRFGNSRHELKCTVSTGFGYFLCDTPVKTAVRMVDVLLYRAKRNGRNQVVGRDFSREPNREEPADREDTLWRSWPEDAGVTE